MPGLFIAAALAYGAVLRFTPFGRYVYAIGGNEEAARLSGMDGRVKIVTYAISGMLAEIAAGSVRRPVPAGQAGCRRRSRSSMPLRRWWMAARA